MDGAGTMSSISASGATASKVDPRMWLLHSKPDKVSSDEVTGVVG